MKKYCTQSIKYNEQGWKYVLLGYTLFMFFPKHSSLSQLCNSEEEVISMLQVRGAD
jgi:hypothetical protein